MLRAPAAQALERMPHNAFRIACRPCQCVSFAASRGLRFAEMGAIGQRAVAAPEALMP